MSGEQTFAIGPLNVDRDVRISVTRDPFHGSGEQVLILEICTEFPRLLFSMVLCDMPGIARFARRLLAAAEGRGVMP